MFFSLFFLFLCGYGDRGSKHEQQDDDEYEVVGRGSRLRDAVHPRPEGP